MPAQCAAFGCYNKGKMEGITYHSFPKEPDLRQKWVNATKRKDWEPTKYTRICSAHFREMDIDRTSLSCVRIRDGAVPSIFPAISQVKDRKKVKKRAVSEMSPPISIPSTPTKKLKAELKKTQSDIVSYKKKVKLLHQKNRRLTKKVANLEKILESLKTKLNFNAEDCSFLGSISQNSDCLIKRATEKTLNPKMRKVYSERLKTFAITLHFLSPKAYSYVRKSFNTALPHPRTLAHWYSSVRAEPGFSEEVFRALKEHCDNVPNKPICALMLDCMAIRQKLEWDGKCFHGTVNVGNTIVLDDCAPIATEALVLHLVCINSTWKIPLGHFFLASTRGEQLSTLVKQCLKLLHEAGIKVASLTSDGTACNIAMANDLGCCIGQSKKELKAWFSHPETNEPVYFFLDPSHMLKLIRNTFHDYGILQNMNNDTIEWQYVQRLHDLQLKEGLRLGNKMNSSHLNYVKQKMKVKLAAQLLSSSVADSLQYLLEKKFAGFEGCAATIEFIRICDNMFDILNSRSIKAKNWKRALYPANFNKHSEMLLKAKHYLSELKNKMGKSILDTKRKTGFLGFIICIDSTLAIYEKYVKGEDHLLNYFPVYKVSQDHLERLFGYVRSRGGHNNNPTCREFTGSFKRILLHKELHETNTGNALVLNKTLILSLTAQKNEIHQINSSTPGWRSLDQDDQNSLDQEKVEDEEVIMDILGNTSVVTCDIVEYIAGFVVRGLKSKIVCNECVEFLSSDEIQAHSLIRCKNRGGLVQPSQGVQKLCLIAESVVKYHINKGCLTSLQRLIEVMTITVMHQCVGLNLFPGEHFLDQDLEQNHFVLLIKVICKKYFQVRLHHFSKLFTESLHKTKVRNHLTKTVHFMGQ